MKDIQSCIGDHYIGEGSTCPLIVADFDLRDLEIGKDRFEEIRERDSCGTFKKGVYWRRVYTFLQLFENSKLQLSVPNSDRFDAYAAKLTEIFARIMENFHNIFGLEQCLQRGDNSVSCDVKKIYFSRRRDLDKGESILWPTEFTIHCQDRTMLENLDGLWGSYKGVDPNVFKPSRTPLKRQAGDLWIYKMGDSAWKTSRRAG